jgi:hypothetical protein
VERSRARRDRREAEQLDARRNGAVRDEAAHRVVSQHGTTMGGSSGVAPELTGVSSLTHTLTPTHLQTKVAPVPVHAHEQAPNTMMPWHVAAEWVRVS